MNKVNVKIYTLITHTRSFRFEVDRTGYEGYVDVVYEFVISTLLVLDSDRGVFGNIVLS